MNILVGVKYTITDNQGNVRVTFERGTDGKVKLNDERHYYPSGLVFMHGENSAVNHFGYGGKEELGDDLGWLDFHARMYDPAIGRWHTPDPLAESFAAVTPYGYCSGDPVNFVDPTGMSQSYNPWTDPDFKYKSVEDRMQELFGAQFYGAYNRPEPGSTGGRRSVTMPINGVKTEIKLIGNETLEQALRRQGYLDGVPVEHEKYKGVGFIIDNKAVFFAYMIMKARECKVEIAAFELKCDEKTFYFIQPWYIDENNKNTEKSSMNYYGWLPEGYTRENVVQQWHTHLGSAKFRR